MPTEQMVRACVEAFEFAVEWPVGGIDETIAHLDGPAIVAAASQSAGCGHGQQRTQP